LIKYSEMKNALWLNSSRVNEGWVLVKEVWGWLKEGDVVW